MSEIRPSGTTLEKMVLAISIGIGKVENGIIDVAYGKPDGEGGIKFPGNKRKTNGLIPILREINKIDLCNILNYALGNIKLTGGFLGEKLKKLQDKAKKLSDILDGNFLDPSKMRDPVKVALLIAYIAELDQLLDKDICTIFPKIQTFKNNLNDIVSVLIQFNAAAASYEVLRNAKTGSNVTTELTGSDGQILTGSATGSVTIDDAALLALQKASAYPGSAPNINFAAIPNAEIQKVMGEIRKIKEILNIIISITSVGDIASRLIPNQIKELQKILNPAALLPMIRVILALAQGLNQLVKGILGIVSTLKLIVKVVSVLLQVTKIAIKIIRLLPIPLMFAVYSVVGGLDLALRTLEVVVNDALKRVNQIGRLLDVIYDFCILVISILEEVIAQIEILIFTLESCAATNTDYTDGLEYRVPEGDQTGNFKGQPGDGTLQGGTSGGRGTGVAGRFGGIGGGTGVAGGGLTGQEGRGGGFGSTFGTGAPLIRDLKAVKGQLMFSLDALNTLTDNYRKAKENADQAIYNGYTFKIEEEELADKGVKHKRRRAEAFDLNGILVMATDLTFATDNTILFEELRLKLVNAGLTKDTGAAVPALDKIINALQLPTTDTDIYASVGITGKDGMNPEEMMYAEGQVIQAQLSKVLDSIKGTQDLSTLVAQTADPASIQLKADIKAGKVDLTKTNTTGGLSKAMDKVTALSEVDSINPDILTDGEVKRLQGIVNDVTKSDKRSELIKTQTYREAIRKLRANETARKEAGMKN